MTEDQTQALRAKIIELCSKFGYPQELIEPKLARLANEHLIAAFLLTAYADEWSVVDTLFFIRSNLGVASEELQGALRLTPPDALVFARRHYRG
jgi:hypothetical protein